MKTFFNKRTISTSAAIFSMFFGAGNSVFPIELGKIAGDQIVYALIGLLLTGIGGPLLGLLTTLRYKGDSRLFFSRWGNIPGTCFLILSLALLGPFCVLPRCYIVAHAAFSSLYSETPPLLFFCIFSSLSLLCTLRKQSLLALLGYVLSPILLLSLLAIILTGVSSESTIPNQPQVATTAFFYGVSAGYNTMDLIAAIIFSGSIWTLLSSYYKDSKQLYSTAWRSSLIGGTLLGMIYCGLAIAASLNSSFLVNVPPEKLLTSLATITLGKSLAGIANIAVALACFTTVVSLVYAIARICHVELFAKKIDEKKIIIAIIIFTTGFATFGFHTIQNILHPIIYAAYPVIIALTIANLWGSYRPCINSKSAKDILS